ncbi:low-density lipoprotein receptor-related protein 8 isoform X1 [Lates japonicus]|uniref:Low-density lipoprotein receptor-related protein 8 isoform X1 n=1 Tax=Lates japonicus TaxID=270547 RepID=A0AAD3NNH2_LATJO|nr:low-density lipoprotein receptor-related protein 8 isoform X1 [Lates japonicus]
MALDVDASTNKMFCAYIKASDSSQQVTPSTRPLEGLAAHWVHKNIYWTDSGQIRASLSCQCGDGRKRKVVPDSH